MKVAGKIWALEGAFFSLISGSKGSESVASSMSPARGALSICKALSEPLFMGGGEESPPPQRHR